MAKDRIDAEGYALIECFGGALRVLEDETVVIGELTESQIQATTIPRFVIKNGQLVESTAIMEYVNEEFDGPALMPAMIQFPSFIFTG